MAVVSRPTPDLRLLGSVLRTYRQANGCTQARLSFASGMTTALISDAENGKRNLSFESLEKWLAALDVTWETFGADLTIAARNELYWVPKTPSLGTFGIGGVTCGRDGSSVGSSRWKRSSWCGSVG